MFNTKEVRRILPIILFFIIYTVIFSIWVQTFLYTLPFLIGLIIAIIVQPIIKFLDKKLKFNHSFSTFLVTLTVTSLLLIIIFFLGIFVIQEVTRLITNVSSGELTALTEPLSNIFEYMENFFNELNLNFFEADTNEIITMIKNSMGIILSFLGTALAVLTSLPAILTMLVVSVFSTFFISRDMDKLKLWVSTFFSNKLIFHTKKVLETSGQTGKKYFYSYLLIYFITFCETFIIVYILDIEYPLTISIITAIADFIPLLGPAIVLLPIALYQCLLSNYTGALGILIGYLLITLIRQIIEPKLVSSMIKIHPLSMLAAVYFSLISGNISILFYITGFLMLYSSFRTTGALPSFVENTGSNKNAKVKQIHKKNSLL